MGAYVIKPWVQVLAWIIAAILVYLNVRLLVGEAIDFFEKSGSVFWKGAIIAGGVFVATLLFYVVLHPLIRRRKLLQ